MQSTINPTEIENFEKFAWWDKPILLHYMNQVRVPIIATGLLEAGIITDETAKSEKPLKGIKILDVGCGGGIYSEALAKLGANVTGVDASPEIIKLAKDHAELDKRLASKLNYVYDTIEEFSEKNPEKFDVVVSSETVEHVPAKDLFLRSCIKALKPGGLIFITTINRTIKAWLKAIIYYEYITGIITRGRHEWSKFVTPEELNEILIKCNCKIEKTEGWHYNPSTKSFTSNSDVSVFYYIQAIKNK